MITAGSDAFNLSQQIGCNPPVEEQLHSDELRPKCSNCTLLPSKFILSSNSINSIHWNPSSNVQNRLRRVWRVTVQQKDNLPIDTMFWSIYPTCSCSELLNIDAQMWGSSEQGIFPFLFRKMVSPLTFYVMFIEKSSASFNCYGNLPRTSTIISPNKFVPAGFCMSCLAFDVD